ncbi:polyphosphate kinase 2 family protein [Hyphomonas chukchiensis]|uniref:Polyphosphate kinase n=1 Tax=Hyphomonas chukchiensis TaxID=1280947 RepID=A0A062UBW3_9PROT|nr:polyphosphate kinase 2 family protein [Hyphomonas chukchiensis]KCZ58314.1 polyphosphate kinase [Hyphomonas chukchiensis]
MSTPSIVATRRALIATPGKAFDLSARDTGDKSLFEDKENAETSLKKDAAVINELKDMMYAEGKRSLLVVLQGMDTSGKSGTIKGVFSDTTPLGMEVKAFKAPSSNELARDYLWRVHNAVPKKGHIGIFDRSHYEDVLVVKVRGFAPAEEIEQRYAQINAFEKHLTENGVTIVKCMLNVGYEEQGVRLAERLEEPHKLWKFNPGDLEDRKLWAQYMDAYQTAITRCSTRQAPWYVIPSDSRTRRNAMIARLVRGALEGMKLEWPASEYKPGDFDIG